MMILEAKDGNRNASMVVQCEQRRSLLLMERFLCIGRLLYDHQLFDIYVKRELFQLLDSYVPEQLIWYDTTLVVEADEGPKILTHTEYG